MGWDTEGFFAYKLNVFFHGSWFDNSWCITHKRTCARDKYICLHASYTYIATCNLSMLTHIGRSIITYNYRIHCIHILCTYLNATDMWRVFWWLCYGRPADPSGAPRQDGPIRKQRPQSRVRTLPCGDVRGTSAVGRTNATGFPWLGPGFLKSCWLIDVYCGKAHAIDIPFGMFAIVCFFPAAKMVMTWDGHRWFGTEGLDSHDLTDFTHQLTSQWESVEVWRGLYEISLWWTNILLWKITIFNGKIHYFYGHLQ